VSFTSSSTSLGRTLFAFIFPPLLPPNPVKTDNANPRGLSRKQSLCNSRPGILWQPSGVRQPLDKLYDSGIELKFSSTIKVQPALTNVPFILRRVVRDVHKTISRRRGRGCYRIVTGILHLNTERGTRWVRRGVGGLPLRGRRLDWRTCLRRRRIWGDLDQLVLGDELDGLLEGEAAEGTRRVASSAVLAAHVGEALLADAVDVDVVVAECSPHDHALVDLGALGDEEHSSLLDAFQRVGVVTPWRSRPMARGALRNLALVAMWPSRMAFMTMVPRVSGQHLRAQADEAAAGDANSMRTRPEPWFGHLRHLALRGPRRSMTCRTKLPGMRIMSCRPVHELAVYSLW